MAVLDNTDFTSIRRIVASDPDMYNEFKVWGLSKATWKALFQAAEDWFVNGFTVTPTQSFKAALEAQAGAMTNAQAKAVIKMWFSWRIGEVW